MSDAQLATLGTFGWIIGTSTLFVALAHWSAGGSWGISSAIVRGLAGWTSRDAHARLSNGSGELGPIEAPRLDRLWSNGNRSETQATADPAAELEVEPQPELEDLGSRRLL